MSCPAFGLLPETSRPRTPAKRLASWWLAYYRLSNPLQRLHESCAPHLKSGNYSRGLVPDRLRRNSSVGPSSQLLVGRRPGKRKDVNRLSC